MVDIGLSALYRSIETRPPGKRDLHQHHLTQSLDSFDQDGEVLANLLSPAAWQEQHNRPPFREAIGSRWTLIGSLTLRAIGPGEFGALT